MDTMSTVRRGRKPLPEGIARKGWFSLRFTDAERQALRETAVRIGCSEADVVRMGIALVQVSGVRS